MLRFVRLVPSTAFLRSFTTTQQLSKIIIRDNKHPQGQPARTNAPASAAKPGVSYRGSEAFDKDPLSMNEWDRFNEIIYPPSKPGDPIRPAEICSSRRNIMYSPKQLIGVTYLVRGMSIDEAIRQLAFRKDRGSHILKELLEETQQRAVDEHFVEYRSRLFVADCFVSKGFGVPRLYKGLRRNASLNTYHYSNLFVRLREGDAPRNYRPPAQGGHDKFAAYLERLRARRIIYDL